MGKWSLQNSVVTADTTQFNVTIKHTDVSGKCAKICKLHTMSRTLLKRRNAKVIDYPSVPNKDADCRQARKLASVTTLLRKCLLSLIDYHCSSYVTRCDSEQSKVIHSSAGRQAHMASMCL